MAHSHELETYPTLVSALETLTVEDLKTLHAIFYALKKPVHKADLIAMLASHYEGDGLVQIWQRLDDLQKAAVAEVVHSEGYYHNAARFVAKYGESPQWSGDTASARAYGYHRSFSPLCLFFFNNHMPADIKTRLWDIVPEPAKTVLVATEYPPESVPLTINLYDRETRASMSREIKAPATVLETQWHAQDDVVSMLRLVEAGRVAVSDKTRLPSAATVKDIAGILSAGDYYSATMTIDGIEYDDTDIGPIKGFAWPMILQVGGLAELSGKKLKLTPAGQKALTSNTADVLRSLWKKWLTNTLLDELRRIDTIKGQTGAGGRALTSPSRRRPVIAQAMGDCPVWQWVTIDDFVCYMVAQGYDFEVTRDTWSLYVTDSNYGSLGHSGYSWVIGNRYILCFLFEYAATLGLIDIAYISPRFASRDYGDIWGTDDFEFFSRYDGLLGFRVNTLGAYCLGLSPAYAEANLGSRPVLRVLASQEIVTTGARLPAGDSIFLDIYTQRMSDSAWKLGEDKLLAALAAGNEIAKLREFLSARCTEELPAPVLELLADVEKSGTQISDAGTARLFECSDTSIARHIASDKLTRRHCQLAGERHLVVADDQVAAFRKTLSRLGYVLPGASRT